MGCANDGTMDQSAAGALPFEKIPAGAEDVQVFDHMHTPLLSGGKFVEKGCIFVFDTPNAHILKGRTGGRIKKIISEAEQDENDDIVMTVPFDQQTLTWKTDGYGNAKPLFNIANNVHQI